MTVANAQSRPAAEVGQSIADIIRDAAKADIAFVPQGVFVVGEGTLLSQVQYPTDTVQVVSLTGQQIRAALEKAVLIYPTANPAFLYVSGISFAFAASSPAEHRVKAIRRPQGYCPGD